ncbi:beta-D-glucosyl crocetin beta-1,6-glucosyltransferase-like [Sesamum indicum]|uniref:Glycosyltransferase n=1 Tax=Sesamum indicum TaxID=4182 RepID=A0A6F8PDY4_SESIN|nr:beta-D-glucosyl crocetin beta-1,6-glucosyltransferase-like [Sesamum indicum]BBK26428.1 UDP-glycosyltransferase [Sesamum indicum]
MEAKQANLSILMFPWIGHGHVFPYLELAKNLSTHNFDIFFCSTAVNLSSVNDVLANTSSSVSIQLVELHLPSAPELPPCYHTTKNAPPHLLPKLHEAFQMSNSSFSDIITSLNPDMLIYDGFQPWAAKIASSLGIPAVHFATAGAVPYSFYFHSFISATSAFPYEEIYLRDYERKAYETMVFSDLGVKKNDLDSAIGHFTLSCDVVLVKTCRAIEGKYMDYLSVLCKKKLVPVGPLVTHSNSEEGKHAEIVEWLSQKNKFSTVFISFGSENYLSKDQMVEIAKGLEASDVNFIWVVRFPPGERVSIEEVVPKGFLDRVQDRGMILQGWAPQTQILAHPSTGAFLSHCGMSSIIESIYFGVPVIAMPLKLDQPFNARLVVEAGVGIEVKRDENGGFGGADVADAINKVIVKETGEDIRLKAAELSEKMKNEEEDAINEAADQLRRVCMEHKQQK